MPSGMPGPSELAELLEELKVRSGRSYTALARRTGLSRSTLHRYCQGCTVPGSFGTVERVARVCGASPAELDRLYRAWARETAGVVADPDETAGPGAEADPGPGPVTGSRTEPVSGAGPETDARPEPGPGARPWPAAGSGPGAGAPTDAAPGPYADSNAQAGQGSSPPAVGLTAPAPWWLPRGRALRTAVLLLVVSAVVVAAVLTGREGGNGGAATEAGGAKDGTASSRPGQEVRGPQWALAPRTVPAAFFGFTMNTDTGAMPGFKAGSVRLWHSNTEWPALEPKRGQYDWTVLERMVRGAERARLPVLLTLGGTPRWAAPHGPRSVHDSSSSAPPDDLRDWDRYVKATATRYRGRIEAYELWDYPNHRIMWTGSVRTLAEMVRRASKIIRRADPGAQVVCPSFGQLWERKGRELYREFVRTGALDGCDAAALKLPPRRAEGRPEEIIELAVSVRRLLYQEGRAEVPLWNTGTDWNVTVAPRLDARRARDYGVRFYLAGLYSRHFWVRRMYFYSWGSTDTPVVVQPNGGAPTEAGRRIGRLRTWLDGARITSCGNGAQLGLPEGAYVCRFERKGHRLTVCWTASGRARKVLEDGAYRLRRMDGSTVPVRAGDRITFGEEPLLIERRAG